MKQIKFKVFVREENKVFDVVEIGFPIYQKIGYPTTIIYTKNGENYSTQSKKSVLLQFTGRKDDAGKEIYEGNILKFTDKEDPYYKLPIEKVIFEEGAFRSIEIKHKWKTRPYKNDECLLGGLELMLCEVIGNIYENPELLK